jgi:hypothetical protein
VEPVGNTERVIMSTCEVCGRPVAEHNRHVRFLLPEPVLALPAQELTPGTWMSHASARESVMMQVPNVGAFVRVLLPVHLSEGDSVTFGVWLAIDPRGDTLRSVAEVWGDVRYADLQLEGWLGNKLPSWGLLASPVTAAVRDVDETPYCVASADDMLNRVLTEEWDRDAVLTAIGPR